MLNSGLRYRYTWRAEEVAGGWRRTMHKKGTTSTELRGILHCGDGPAGKRRRAGEMDFNKRGAGVEKYGKTARKGIEQWSRRRVDRDGQTERGSGERDRMRTGWQQQPALLEPLLLHPHPGRPDSLRSSLRVLASCAVRQPCDDLTPLIRDRQPHDNLDLRCGLLPRWLLWG